MTNTQDSGWEILLPYFPDLTPLQKTQFAALEACYREWNARINVISRKDIDNIYLHHVLHSLAIAKLLAFPHGARILDVGTGGGFPGIPLAILFPRAQFTLCDAIGKKVRVAEEVAKAVGLSNVATLHARAEDIPQRFDFVVSRAVCRLDKLASWIWGKIDWNFPESGLLCLKGGDLEQEYEDCQNLKGISVGNILECPICRYFSEPFFEGKAIVYLKK